MFKVIAHLEGGHVSNLGTQMSHREARHLAEYRIGSVEMYEVYTDDGRYLYFPANRLVSVEIIKEA